MTGTSILGRKVKAIVPVVALLLLGAPNASGATGDLYVADTFAGGTFDGTVFRVDPATGARIAIASGPPFDGGPEGIAVDLTGQLLVADDDAVDVGAFEGAIFRVDPASGARTTVASGSPFSEPFSLDVAPDGRIIVADEEADQLAPGDSGSVFSVDPATGAIHTLAMGPPLIDPVGVAVTPAGDQAFIVDDGAPTPGALFRLDLTTGALTTVASGPPFEHPSGVVLTPKGELYVADAEAGPANSGVIFLVDSTTGARTPLASGPPMTDPVGIAQETSGEFVIADGEADAGGLGAVFRMSPSGALATLSSGAPFEDPTGITVAPPLCRGKSATVVGTAGNDVLTASPLADVIVGLGGRDRISAGGGNDLICGGKAKDRIRGGKGGDRLYGEAGKDKLYGEGGKDKLVGGKGRKDKCVGGKAKDRGKGCELGKL